MSRHSLRFHIVRATTAGLLAAIIALAPLGILPAPKASAQWVVTDPGATALLAGIAANTTVSAVANTDQSVVTHVLNSLAWMLAKVAIQSMTKSIVNWINSGFHGSPAFATDLNQTLRGLADAAADQFFDSLESQAGIDVRTPFRDQVTQAVRDSYYKESANGIHHNYNLYQASDDPKAFLNGQFGKGGFDAWFSTVLNSDNNPIGSLFKTKNELAATIANVHDNQLHELDWGQGFLSWRGSCKTPAPAASAYAPSPSTQAAAVQPSLSLATASFYAGVFLAQSAPTLSNSAFNAAISGGGNTGSVGDIGAPTLTNAQGAAISAGQANTGSVGDIGVPASKNASVSLSGKDPCLAYNIETPGSIIENQLGITTTSPLRQLELADSINEIVSALMGQLVNHILGGGGLSGASQPSSGGGSSALDQATDPSQYSQATTNAAQGFSTQITTTRTRVVQFQTDWQKIDTAAEAAKTACNSRAADDTLVVRIQQVIDAATSALGRAAGALVALDNVSERLAASATPDSVATTRLSGVANVSEDWQNLIASSTLPSDQEMFDAHVQSQDNTVGTTTQSRTVYTEMTDAAETCQPTVRR